MTDSNITPFHFDQERLQTIADKKTIHQGILDHRENKVLEIDFDQDVLWGMVEGEDPDIPEDVTIMLSENNKLSFQCECELAPEKGVCRHVVAVLCMYDARYGETDQLLTATDSAIKDRIKRGRSEVEVKCLSNGDTHWFGEWQASSIGTSSHFSRKYRVIIRDLNQRANFCTCPDFTTNQLGTCKHIEAVLHKISKHPQFDSIKKQPAPVPYVYQAWDVEEAPQIMLHRSQKLTLTQKQLLEPFFNSSEQFTGRLPEAFFQFMDLVEDRDDIHIGQDAISHVKQMTENISHKQRSVQIKKQIRSSRRIPGIHARLYPYQVDGVAFLAGTGRALLADDMGLGKTLQAISAAVWLKENEGIKKTLIICPASLKHQWAREIEKFTDLDTQVIQGTPPQRGVQYRRDCSFFIMNYELLLRDLSLINESINPDLIILDEAQRIKNWRTKIATAVKMISSRYAFVLTGTPLENRLEDLYSLMQVVEPRILGPLWRYMVDFHITDKKDKVLGYRNLSTLRKRLAPVMLRRDRKIVRDQLPDRISQQIDVPLDTKQRELHDSAMSAAGYYSDIAKKRPLTPTEQNRLMAALQQARMACDAAGLVDKESEGSPKIDELETILEETCQQSGLKVVVFSGWKMMTKMVETRLRKMNIGYVTLHGGIPTAKRGDLMESFQNDDSVQVFLSTDAGGVGLNLQAGSVLVNLDVPWNPAVLEQRNGRIHRLGQTRTVQIITMVASDSYEENVLALVNSKQDLFDNVIAEDGEQDVVGVSKKLLETLIEDIAEKPEGVEKTEDIDEQVTPSDLQKGEASESTGSRKTKDDPELTACIEKIQQEFGQRIERILGVDGGLLTILDRVDDKDDGVAATLSETIPVAILDQRTLSSLERLGKSSPVSETTLLYDITEDNTPQEQKASRLQLLAEEKLRAATVLMGQNCENAAVDLLLAALLAAASDRANRDTPITAQELGVWLFSEALPRDFLSQEEGTLIMRTVSLTQAPQIPEKMLQDLLLDVEQFVLDSD